MIFVAPATGLAGAYPMLLHAEWDGLTVGDLVFPSFLVTSGLSLSFLLRCEINQATRVRLIRRFVLLVAIGLAYNAYGTSWLDIGTLRITGVLQTIGIAGACAAVVILIGRALLGDDRISWVITIATATVAVYGIGLAVGACMPTGRCSPYFHLDAVTLGADRTYRRGQAGFDPEGMIASLSASAFVLYGYSAGVFLRRHGKHSCWKAAVRITSLATACLIGGIAASLWMPANKRLMTPAFVLLASGIALVGLCVTYLIIDVRGSHSGKAERRRWPSSLVALGRNALIVYLLERFLYQTAKHVHVRGKTIEELLLAEVLPFGEPAVHLVYSAAVLAVIVGVTGAMHRRRWYWAL